MSAIEEVVRVLRSSSVMLSAKDICDKGDFSVDSASVMATLSAHSQPGKTLERERVDGIYRYRIRESADLSEFPDAQKNGKHAIEAVSKAHAVSLSSTKSEAPKKDEPPNASHVFAYSGAKDAAERIAAILKAANRDGLVYLRNDNRIKLVPEGYDPSDTETLVGKYTPHVVTVHGIAGDIEAARDKLTADKRAKLIDAPQPKKAEPKPAASAIPIFIPPAEPKAEQPAPPPVAQPSEKTGQLPTGLVRRDKSLVPPHPSSLILCVDDNGSDFADVTIHPLFVGLICTLPKMDAKWTPAQRAAWLDIFNAVCDGVHPESRA